MPIELAHVLEFFPYILRRFASTLRRGKRCITYPDGFVDWFVAVAMGVLIVGKSARLTRECSLALPGSSHCCPSE
jgi:hypothetical protein